MDELKKLFLPACEEEKAKQKSKILASQRVNALALESVTVSEHSPRIVSDDEIIARQIFSPIHIDNEDQSIKPAAFEDVSNKGLSVNRLCLAPADKVHVKGKQKADNDNEKSQAILGNNKKPRCYLGFVTAQASSIRGFLDEEERVFAIYDSSLQESIEHADVCMIYQDTQRSEGPKWANNYRRRKLQKLFSTLQQHLLH